MEAYTDDMTIHHADDGSDWAHYLRRTLSNEMYQICSQCRSLIKHSHSQFRTKMNIILVSPDVVEVNYTGDIKELLAQHDSPVVAILLGVGHSEFAKLFRAHGLETHTWNVVEAQSNQGDFRDMLVKIIDTYERSALGSRLSDEISEIDYDEEFPREPEITLSPQSSLDKTDDDTYNVPSNIPGANRITKLLVESSEKHNVIYVAMERPVDGTISILLDDTEPAETHLVGGSLYEVKLPDKIGSRKKIQISVLSDGELIDSTTRRHRSNLEKVHEILESQLSPMSFMCSAFGIKTGDTDALDQALSLCYRKFWAPELLHHLQYLDENVLQEEESESKWPNMLHFAAEFNLKTLAAELLQTPGMLPACCTQNVNGQMPHEIAITKKHTDISTLIQNYLEVHKRRLEGHDSGFMDRVSSSMPSDGMNFPMDSLTEQDLYESPVVREDIGKDIRLSHSFREDNGRGKAENTDRLVADNSHAENATEDSASPVTRVQKKSSMKSKISKALTTFRQRKLSIPTVDTVRISESSRIHKRDSVTSISSKGGRKDSISSETTSPGATGSEPRDSGSFSEDEENSVNSRKKKNSTPFKKQKRKSVRIHRAQKEVHYQLPVVPIPAARHACDF